LYEITYLNKYAWWLEDKGRRETPAETWARVTNYSLSLYEGPASREALEAEAKLMYEKCYNLEVAPAGRTMRIGGTTACYKFPEMNFNCSFVTVDDITALVDSFHMSLCSVGLGYRVLIEDVAKLEGFCREVLVDHEDYKHDNSRREYTSNEFLGYQGKYPVYRLTIGDSKEGWVEALRVFLLMSHTHSWDSNGIKWTINYNFIRPAGERIKTAGGFAAGHTGMREMFTRLGATLSAKEGTLNPVAAMDSQNIVGKNVVTGGNRRSAQIALGSPEDREFVEAKKNLYTKMEDGSWKIPYELEHRKMSNNSVVFQKKPSWEELCDLFETIKNNGEPGFFNLEAAKARRPDVSGLNPCLTADTWINTLEGPRQIKDLRDAPYKAMINGVSKDATFFWSSGIKSVFKLTTKEGYSLKLTADHKVLTKDGWKEAQALGQKDLIILNNTFSDAHEWSGKGTFEEGWLIGSLVGDGTYTKGKNENCHSQAELRYWGEDKEHSAAGAKDFLYKSVEMRTPLKIMPTSQVRPFLEIGGAGLSRLAEEFGVVMGAKINITPQIEKASSRFYEGFLQGLFDADGSPQGSTAKGRSVRLAQANYEFLCGVQRMLARLGIKCTTYECRKAAGLHSLPDGHGGMKDYYCKQMSELVISRSSMYRYAERIGFSEPKKAARLADIIGAAHNIGRLYTDKFEASFKSLEYIGEEEVFDCTVQDLHRFDANGMIVHNCAEILLDSKGVCNLSTVIMPSHLTVNEDGEYWVDYVKLEESVRLATRIGLRQTNVTLSLPEWDKVQKRDRLTGVSYTGMEDMLDRLASWFRQERYSLLLQLMGKWANDEADKYAYEMRVPRPLLVTAVKPEGTISQLPTVSSGLHRAFAPYYIRRMSVTKTDPLNQALKELGVPWEEDRREKESTREIFLFPVETGAPISAYDERAVDQLSRYFLNQQLYTDHKSSCTIYVGSGYDGYDDEWDEVIQKVWDNWDNMVAVSFLPKHSLENPPFPQMPYEWTSKESYDKMMETFPDLSNLGEIVAKYEKERTEFYETGDACEGGVCPTA
jgi:intein/homing endonuclease